MGTYTDVVSALAIWVADPLVPLGCLPEVLLLEEAEGKIDEGEDLEDGGDNEGLDVDNDPVGRNLRGDAVENADVQESRLWAGDFELNVSFELGCDVEHIKSVNVGINAHVQGDQEVDRGRNVDVGTHVDTEDQIDLGEGSWLSAEVLLVNDWVVGGMTLELPCSAVQ